MERVHTCPAPSRIGDKCCTNVGNHALDMRDLSSMIAVNHLPMDRRTYGYRTWILLIACVLAVATTLPAQPIVQAANPPTAAVVSGPGSPAPGQTFSRR